MMGLLMSAKKMLSINMCLVLLKTLGFIVEGIPKLQLLTKTLAAVAGELIGFTVLFLLTLVAFAITFWLTFGSTLPTYYSIAESIVTVHTFCVGFCVGITSFIWAYCK
jgi:hypothetical protein